MYVHALNVHRLNNFPAIIADIYLICHNKFFNYGKGIILKIIIPNKSENVICFCDGFKILVLRFVH